MTEFILHNISFIAILPLLICVFIIFYSNSGLLQSRRATLTLTLISTFIGIICSSVVLVHCIHNPHYILESSFSWIKFDDYMIDLKIGTMIDSLTALMLFIVTTVSFLVQLFAHGYMKDDPSYQRFYAYLNLFSFSMLGLVLSSNLIQTYIFWELVGVSSYLLIGFWFTKRSASKAARRAFVINRIGDVCLLLGIITLIYYAFNFEISQGMTLLSFVNISFWSSSIYGLTDGSVFYIICLLLLMGSVAKSAQFPLHVWLEDAMEGPTPVSALIHAATMVAAGVFLIARFYPLFTLSEPIMNTIAAVGIFTAFLAALVAISQNDIKKVLAYSTCSQLGIMFFALGIGAYTGGIFHLLTHAYFKALLFLCAGLIITCLAHQQDLRFMGGLRKHFPVCAAAYIIASISISGLFFSGFYSKEMIYGHAYDIYGQSFLAVLVILTILTTFYIFRTYFMMFEGEYRGTTEPQKPGLVLNIPIIILAVAVVFAGTIFAPMIGNLISFDFGMFIEPINKLGQENIVILTSLCASAIGILIAFIMHKLGRFTRPEPSKNILWQISYNKFYINKIYSFLTAKIFFGICVLTNLIDRYIIDGIVNLCGAAVRLCAYIISRLQNGNVQAYITYSIGVIGIFLFALVWVYYWMMKV